MNWSYIIVVIAFLVYWFYNMYILKLFGVPHSLSMTYYLFQEKKLGKKWYFPLMMFTVALLLLPSWIEISDGSDLQFLAFLSVASICFTGSAPAFFSSKLEYNVHMVSAILSAVFALLWVIFVANSLYIIIIWFLVFSLFALFTRTVKSSYIYWLEMVALMSTFCSIMVYYVNNFM